ncbi:hypothetical protein PHYPSEUDO_011883, partial [Phytophthora pseudosyringae]
MLECVRRAKLLLAALRLVFPLAFPCIRRHAAAGGLLAWPGYAAGGLLLGGGDVPTDRVIPTPHGLRPSGYVEGVVIVACLRVMQPVLLSSRDVMEGEGLPRMADHERLRGELDGLGTGDGATSWW